MSKLLVSVKVWCNTILSQYKTPIPGPWVGLLAVLLEVLLEVLLVVLWVAGLLW